MSIVYQVLVVIFATLTGFTSLNAADAVSHGHPQAHVPALMAMAYALLAVAFAILGDW